MKIITRYIEDELYISENENGNTVSVDMRHADEKQNLSPVEMILASVAACAAVDIVSMLRKKRKTFIDLIVETTGVRREEHPRGLIQITSKYTLFSPDTSLEAFVKVAKLATYNYCSAAASVKAEINIECEVFKEKYKW